MWAVAVQERLAVGDKVLWNGKCRGTVRFFGATDFASGDFVGVELDEPIGMHDGTVMGVPYFSCKPKYGVICPPSMVEGVAEEPPPAPVAPPPALAATPAPAPASVAQPEAPVVKVNVGQRVLWHGVIGDCKGTVRFVGPTGFASGDFVGVELDEPRGMHDGDVMGRSYFTCKPKCGLFTLPNMVEALPSEEAPAPAAPVAAPEATTTAAPVTPAAPPSTPPASEFVVGQRVMWTGIYVRGLGTVRFKGTTEFASGELLGIELDEPKGMHEGSVFGTSYFSCKPKHGVLTPPSMVRAEGDAPAAPTSAPPVQAPPSLPMRPSTPSATVPVNVGEKVLWNGKCEGTVRFVGATDFAAGDFVGIELDEAMGMHNGEVMGVKYFDCKDKYGVLSLPSLVRAVGSPASPSGVAPAAAAKSPGQAAPAAAAPPPSEEEVLAKPPRQMTEEEKRQEGDTEQWLGLALLLAVVAAGVKAFSQWDLATNGGDTVASLVGKT